MYNVNAGHTLTGADIGTRGLNGLAEEILTRQLAKEIINELFSKEEGSNLVKIDHADTLNESLNKQVALCNAVTAKMNIVIHFNTTPGGTGTEIYTYQGKYVPEADRVLKNMELLGFRNRGIKSKGLALVNRTSSSTIYIEVCFIDNAYDVSLLNKYGMREIARAIVSGVLGSNYSVPNIKEEKKKMKNLVVYGEGADKRAAEYLADYLRCPICNKDNLIQDVIDSAENIYMVGGTWKPTDKTILISGSDRFETIKAVLKQVGK